MSDLDVFVPIILMTAIHETNRAEIGVGQQSTGGFG